MKNITNNCLGFKVNVSVPESVDEFDKLAGKSGAALESATMNVVYRSWNNFFREKFSEHLAQATKIARKTEVVLDKENNPKKDDEGAEILRYTETAAEHVDHVFATLVKEGKAADVASAQAAYAADAQLIADSITFDPAEREPASKGPKKVGKKWIEAATEAEARGILATAAEKLTAKLGYPVPADIPSVAAALAEKSRRDQAEADRKAREELGL